MLRRSSVVMTLTLGLSVAAIAAQRRVPPRPAAPKPPVDPALYQALEWRNVGPFGGGPVTAVAGFASRPSTFLLGSPGGGIWMSEDAGTTWRNVSDGSLRTGAITALAVADSDANVVYAGTAEDGVYRSTDGGRTWAPAGLDRGRSVAALRVHPANPEVAYAAALGGGSGRERGVHRTADGGRTWKPVLALDEAGGACDLAIDPTNPRVVFAAVCDRSGSSRGSGLQRSKDSGESWTKLTEGLPNAAGGRVAVAVSPARPGRVYASLEAEEGGLFRSDDGGDSWQRLTRDTAARLVAHPTDPETVYACGAWLRESIDGGHTLRPLPAPEGEHRALWINPWWPEVLIDGSDGGAAVSVSRGRTWAAGGPQPIARFSRLFVDRSFPYRVYAGDRHGAVAVASRGGGFESLAVMSGQGVAVAANPDDPTFLYVGGEAGKVVELDRRTGQVRDVSEHLTFGAAAANLRRRFHAQAPLVVSAHDPKVLYHGANVLLRSGDRGGSWTAISPDLTRGEPAAIACLAESPHEAGTIWAGTDDGLVSLTRDGGNTWTAVTPPGLGDALVSVVDVSPHDPAAAWVAAIGRRDGGGPQVLKTADYGRTWKRLVAGLPEGEAVRVVREDPVRKGLLYAGGASGAYVSFDDGQSWQSFRLNLKAVAVTDLAVQGDDLVAATDGRGFWILDDLSPLRQIGLEVAHAEVFVFKPRRTVQRRGFARSRNEPVDGGGGALVYYLLAKGSDEPVTLEVLDAGGRVLRRETSAPEAGRLSARAGMNRWVWDLRDGPAGLPVAPGSYQVRLARGDKVSSQGFEVGRDPRVTAGDDELGEQTEMLRLLRERVEEIRSSAGRLGEVRAQASALLDLTKDRAEDAGLREAARALHDRIAAWEKTRPHAAYAALAESLSGADAAPTAGQRERLAELEADLGPWRGERDELLSQVIPSFNASFAQSGLRALRVPESP